MGSRLSTLDKGDSSGPLQNVDFFRTVRAKWMEYFISKLNENILSDLDISKTNEMLQWRDYFNLFAEIRGFVERDNDIKQRLSWHPATEGFMMQKELPRSAPSPPPSPRKGLDDDYTEDEASDVSESDQESIATENKQDSEDEVVKTDQKKIEVKNNVDKNDVTAREGDETNQRKKGGGGGEGDGEVKFSPPAHWNPEHLSPIFFGYSELTVKVYGEHIKGAKEEVLRSEQRAVQAALSKRVEGLAEFERSIRARESKRQQKIEALSTNYEEARSRREETMNREKLIMPPVGFRVYKVR